MNQLVLGGLISLVSVLAGIVAKHWLDIRRVATERRYHPLQLLYGKQIEFFEKLTPLLGELNGYITTIDVWLHEGGNDAEMRVQEAADNSAALDRFYDLLQSYYIFLPAELLAEANRLHADCFHLKHSPTPDRAERCIDRLFSFTNAIRKYD